MNEQQPRGMSAMELGDIPTQAIADTFVGQLERFTRLRRVHGEELNRQGKRLLDRTIVARIIDLKNLGYRDRALQTIESTETPPETPKE